MQYTKLVLEGYKRLMLVNIKRLVWEPKGNMLLLLGSNGSGKSSLLEELTPCPSHRENFFKGGRKLFGCSHNGVEYLLESNYPSEKGTGHHSFKRGDEELNPGGTYAVQLELCQQEFGLTKQIHEVLAGIQTFTNMSTADRRKWLTRLSVVNLDYAFDKYHEINEYARDAVGLIKHYVKRLNEETFDIPTDAEQRRLQSESERLSRRLETLYRMRGTADTNIPLIVTDNSAKLAELMARARTLVSSCPSLPDGELIRNTEEYRERLGAFRSQQQHYVEQINTLADDLDQLRAQQPATEPQVTPEALDQLKSQAATLTQEINTKAGQLGVYNGRLPFIEHDTAGQAIQRLTGLSDRLLNLMQQMPDNGGEFSTAKRQALREQIPQIRQRLESLENAQTIDARRLALLKGCDDVVCPDCQHTFKPGVDRTELETLPARLEQRGTIIENGYAKLKAAESELERQDEYSAFVYQYRQITQDYSDFALLWEYFAENRVLSQTPKQWITDLIQWVENQKVYVEHAKLVQTHAIVTERIKQAEQFDHTAASYHAKHIASLTAQIETLTDKARQGKGDYQRFESAGNAISKLQSDIEQLTNDFQGFIRSVKLQAQALVTRGLNAEIETTALQMADIKQKLNQSEQMANTLNALEKEHQSTVEWRADMQLLGKALSPKDGLIGRYLMGFMQRMVGLMNAVINEIWTYPLEILPSKVEKEEFDYTFPLLVKNGAVKAPDISRGSSSQRDIVNFAFRLMVMRFLKFERFPLFLDEFGTSFDEQHRQNLIPFLNSLMEHDQINQIFYISHFNTMHGAFSQAEILVLDPTNITVPIKYNVNATIE